MDVHVTNAVGDPLERTAEGAFRMIEGQQVFVCVRAPLDGQVVVEHAGRAVAPTGVTARDGHIELEVPIEAYTWAGRSTVECRCGERVARVVLDVSPSPDKLGSAAFAELLDELVGHAAGLPYGLSPGDHGAELDRRGPRVLHPFVIEAVLPELNKALGRLRRELLRETVRTRRMAPLSSARHVDGRTLRWLASHPQAWAAIRPERNATGIGDARTPIEQSHVVSSPDHPANRYLVYLLRRVGRALADTEALLIEAAGSAHARTRDDAQARAWALRATVRDARVTLRQVLATDPLRSVTPRAPTAGAAQAIVDHPLYARIQRLARTLLHPGMRLDADANALAALRHTWDLFELVVLFRLVTALRAVLGDAWNEVPVALTLRGLFVAPVNGEVVRFERPDGLRVSLRYQSTFTSIRQCQTLDTGRRSISRQRVPDYVVEVRREDVLVAWLLLDAKYRASRNAIHDGLADMHVYRDALRIDGQPAWGGFVIVPTTAHVAEMAAATYCRLQRFGAVEATPNALAQALRDLMASPRCI